MNKSNIYIAISTALLPLSVNAAIPTDVDKRWRQSATITHPDKSFYPNPDTKIQAKRKNIFDWRTQHLQIGMANLHGDEELALSPFYICESDTLYNIPGEKLLTKDIMGPGNVLPTPTSCSGSYHSRSYAQKFPDINPNEGWELIKFNLGYKMSHYRKSKTSWSADGGDAFSSNQYPYIILYNRMTAKLRVMGYFPDYSIGTGMSVTLSTSGKTKIFNGTKATDAQFYPNSKTGFGAINNSRDGAWGVADFNLELDPCSPGRDIDLTIAIQPKSVDKIELYGHSVGLSENITGDNIADPSKYLLDVSGNLNDNLDQAGSYTVNSLDDLNSLFNDINDSATSDAVASDALGAASAFLGGLMELSPSGNSVNNGLKAMSGVLGGAGSIMGTQAAAVPNFSPIIPQITFSEIYLRGESVSSDPGVKVKLRLPGSLSTAWKNFDENAVSNISYPLYDEPLGLFTLLTTPKVRISKAYSDRSNSNGYKVVTKFNPSNVILASNTKSGLNISGWAGKESKGINITGRLKIKYLVDSNVTPSFTNLHDIDGSDKTYSYVSNTTNGRKTKLYTVVTDEVPLMHLNRILSGQKVPSITVKGGTAVVDNVSLVVTAKNNTDTIHDNILNQNIKMINKRDSEGNFVPYYISMKEYPTIFNESVSGKFNPNADIDRLINSKQITISNQNPALGVDIRLGSNNSPSIKGYCSASGDYNKSKFNGSYSIVPDEDMSYYTYKPKQVSGPTSNHLSLTHDVCYFCAHARTFGFLSFNLNETIGLNGFRKPKKVTLKLNSKMDSPGRAYDIFDYRSKYFFSANKSTQAMRDNKYKAFQPKYATLFKSKISRSPSYTDVTKHFNAAIDRVKNNNGRYETPRMSFALYASHPNTSMPPWIWSSEHSYWTPRLIVQY
ncbi:hypothetical protein [Vibrio sp. ED002]|uniref:hypothetical protein n=1 Tax=Vibrio sp. ED002 TaxID=2785123 RepID=UPI00200F10CB|nr:hypothetical protein [Vibrio sp. ED002]UQA54453.1 hypothetical protein ITG12_27370 [Vibrio sp. ED002]